MPRGRRKLNIQDYDKQAQEINFKEEAREVKRLAEMGKPPAPGVGLDGKPLYNASDLVEDEESLGSLPAKKKGGRPRKVELAQAKEELGKMLAEARENREIEAEMLQQEAREKEALEVAREIQQEKMRAAEPVVLDGTEKDFVAQLESLYLMTEIAEAIGTTRKCVHALIQTANVKPFRVYRGYGYYTVEQAKALKRTYEAQYRRNKQKKIAELKAALF